MKQLPDRVKTIDVDVLGETTKTRYIGTFRAKVVLTNDEEALIERFYKQSLPDDSGVKEDLRLKIATIAELRVKVVEGPAWWSGSREGRDMVEMDPLYSLMFKINESYKGWLKEVEDLANQKSE